MKNFFVLWGVTLVGKLILAQFFPLIHDEAYYWVWSQRLQLSYYDHPPLIAWLIKLGDFLPASPLSVRLFPAIMSHGLFLVWLMIWQTLALPIQRFHWFFWLALLSPMLGFGGIVATPDIPVLFFWSLSTLFALRVLKDHKSLDYGLLGISLGLGFCSKYHIVVFPLILLVYLAWSKRIQEIFNPKVFLTIVFGLIASLPVLIWNYQNGWISFIFQLRHGFVRPEYRMDWTLSYVLAQMIVLFPTVIYSWSVGAKSLGRNQKLLVYLSVGPLIFFFLSSLKALVEINWPIIAYPAFLAVAALGARTLKPLLASMIFWSTAVLVMVSLVITPWLRLPGDGSQKIIELTEYQPVLEAQKKYQPLYGNTYQMASWVWFQSQQPFFKLRGMSRVDFYDLMPESWPSEPIFFVALRNTQTLPDWLGQHGYSYQVAEKLEPDFTIWKVEKR